MKRILLIILLLSLFVGVASAALTYDETYYMQHLAYLHSGSSTTDPMYLFMNEIIGYVEGSTALSSLKLSPTDTAPTAAEGAIYASDADNGLKYYTGTAWVDIDVSGASSLGTAYTAGQKITLSASNTVEIECPDDTVSAGPVLLLDCDEDTDNIAVLQITDAGAGICIDIDGTTGDDIQGTSDSWAVDYAGLGTFAGLQVNATDITLENDGKIENSTDTEILIAENSEDLIFDFTTNGVTIKSTTTLVAVNWGDVDAHTGLNALAFDGAVANTITQTGTGAADDLTISQAASAQDASLILQSSGTGTDALSLISSAADISLSSADNITRTAADNITDTTTDGTYTLTIGGSSSGDYTATVADNFSTVVVGTLTLQNTEAASDITINSVLGTIIIEAEEDCADAILITADGGTSSTARLFNDTGTSVTEGAYAVEVLSDVGGVELRSSSNLAKSIALTSDGGTTGSIWIYNDQGASVTEGAASIELLSDAGGVELRSTANLANAIALTSDGGTTGSILIFNDQGASVTEGAASIEILSDAGGIELKSTANLAKAINIMVDNNTTSSIMIFNDTGTSVTECAASISVWSDAGGIEIQSDANLDDAVVLRVDGGTTSEMTIHNDQGTAADSIEIVSDDGGITITAGDATTADILIDANDILTLLSASIAADGIYIHTDGGAAEGIKIHSDQGTSADSVELLSDVGGITITTVATTAGDILIDANDAVTIVGAGLAANAVYIHEAGGTASTIKIHADTGTDDESIFLDSDVGGITLNANAGSIDIEAVGGDTGDIILNSGDDMTFTVAGDLTLGVTGTFAGGGATMDNFYSTVEVVAGTSDALTAAQSGNMIIYTQTGGSCTVTLPEATSGTVGMWFILIDGNATGGNDLVIDPEGGGQINGATAGNTITCVNDRDGEGILIFSTAADVWYTMACGSSTVWTEE